jgi:hypothetical protein
MGVFGWPTVAQRRHGDAAVVMRWCGGDGRRWIGGLVLGCDREERKDREGAVRR